MTRKNEAAAPAGTGSGGETSKAGGSQAFLYHQTSAPSSLERKRAECLARRYSLSRDAARLIAGLHFAEAPR